MAIDIIHPLVHLNGTSAEHLISELIVATNAIGSAMERLREAAPNQRDYYPKGDEAWTRALREHESRLTRLQSVYDELAEMYTKLENDRDDHRSRHRPRPG